MVFISVVIAGVSGLFFYLYRHKDKFKLSKTTFILLILTIGANISLAHNYIQSLVPGVQDGIGISNKIAYWIITDDNWGRYWSVDLFRSFYHLSTAILIFVVGLLIAFMVVENRLNRLSK